MHSEPPPERAVESSDEEDKNNLNATQRLGGSGNSYQDFVKSLRTPEDGSIQRLDLVGFGSYMVGLLVHLKELKAENAQLKKQVSDLLKHQQQQDELSQVQQHQPHTHTHSLGVDPQQQVVGVHSHLSHTLSLPLTHSD